jgi:hypothetical protein
VNTNQSHPTQLVDQVLSADTVMQEFVVGGGSVHLAAILSLPQVNLLLFISCYKSSFIYSFIIYYKS